MLLPGRHANMQINVIQVSLVEQCQAAVQMVQQMCQTTHMYENLTTTKPQQVLNFSRRHLPSQPECQQFSCMPADLVPLMEVGLHVIGRTVHTVPTFA